ncbi:Na(+)/H(+) exchange regulatory cofactor NHE-RF3 isoform X2 [Alosa sapidissima]|uniref:Na(+)/H(+) exchange regulatory cofactor NHE-RF3 isoform X2 n=1 Tax=Alosa sapidissima TaxID=34773 RepID=UPI001C0A6186|nr:Na(+)/H(+) exchange regulatory cofactor NHE-RF3 isoform X2 [Alosa sapidissima]
MAGIKPRVIVLSKRDGQTFGFFLRVEKDEEGHLIRSLDMGGPAELAGLKDGDRIIRVNGVFVDNTEHAQVADLVRKSGMSVTFHVLSEAAYKQAKEEGWDLAEIPRQIAVNGVAGSSSKPKLCYLTKSTAGFGFSLKSVKGQSGVFMMDVSRGGSADTAGVKENDRLVEVNGENVENSNHEQVVEKVKASGSNVMFLLVDADTDRFYKNKQIRLGPGLATVKHLPHKPRIAELTKGSDGYGFFLRKEPKMAGHYVKDIDRGSPAERAGLKEMDRLVAVAGEEVGQCTHDQVVDKIRQEGDKCCLLVVDAVTDKMYKLGKASPLLFWEETRASAASQPEPTKKPEPRLATPPPSPIPTKAPAPAPAEDYKPKLCQLVKTASGFGFHLNGIQGVPGQYIKEVVRGGAADKAGVEEDDIVVEVNDVNVEKSSHEEVVEMIRGTGNTLRLLLAGRSAYDHLKATGVAVTLALLGLEAPRAPSPKLPEVREEEEEEEEKKMKEVRTEEKEEKAEEEKEERAEEAARPDTPASEPRARTPSVSSSSSNSSFDEQL